MGLVLLTFGVLRLLYSFFAFPNSDEAYYWWWGQNFSLSYYDHPPLFAWIQGLASQVLPHDYWSVRLLNVCSNGILFYTYGQIISYLYGDQGRQSWLIVVTLLCTAPLYFVMLTLAWHDHLMITLCLGASYWLLRYLDVYKQQRIALDGYLYFVVLLLSLAITTKYNALLVGVGFLVTICGDRQLRGLITWRRLLIAGLIFSLVCLPVLMWNYQHDFPSFRYYLNRTIDSGSWLRRLWEPLGFVVISAVMLSPFNCWLLYLSWQSRDQQDSLSKTIYPQLAINTFLTSTIVLFMVSLFSTAYYYWNITGYLLLFPLLPLVIQKYRPQISKLIDGAIIYGLIFGMVFVINYSVLPITALFSQDGDPDGRMLYGWQEVSAVITQLSGDHTELLVTTDYRSASALAYQMPQRQVTALSPRISQFDFVDLPTSDRLILLWDDWYPLTAWHKSQIAKIALDQVKVLPVYRWGVWLKNYYLTTGERLNPLPKLSYGQSRAKN